MLKRLLNGGEETNCVIFSPQSGLSETQLLNLFLKDSKDIKVLLTDPLDNLKNTDILDVFSNLDFNDNRSLKDLVSNLNVTRSSCVVVKSLTGLLYQYSPTEVARFIKFLEGTCAKLYCVLHEDCVEADIYESLIKLCSTTIKIQVLQQNKSSEKGKRICSIVHRKSSGKIVRSKEIFSVTADNKLEVEAYVESKEESALDDTEEIASNLTTFNIGTKQSEEEVKNNLVLPFYTNQQKSNFQGEVKVQKESNKIYYEPDSGDDWDDEDPDDDLDL